MHIKNQSEDENSRPIDPSGCKASAYILDRSGKREYLYLTPL